MSDQNPLQLTTLLGLPENADEKTIYNKVCDLSVERGLMISALRKIALSAGEHGERGTTGEGHATCIKQAKALLAMVGIPPTPTPA
jgi:hypothetical protein